jgi:hypothetical protein
LKRGIREVENRPANRPENPPFQTEKILVPSPKLSRTWRHRPPVKYDFFSLGFASTLQHIKINVEP